MLVEETMIRIKMNVQTMYKGELLRAGKIYEINEKTAEKWIISNIASRVETEPENKKDNQ